MSTTSPRTLVTGGTRGIGAALVRRLARLPRKDHAGHEVIALGRTPGAAPPAWSRGLGADAAAVRFDGCAVEDAAQLAAAFARADADGAGLTGLVSSAALWEPTPIAGKLGEVIEAHRLLLEVNLLGVVASVAAFLGHRRPGVAASIVLVGSTAGQRGESGHGAYAASKAALSALAKSWAVELGPLGVRVNVVAPGWAVTDMTAAVMDDPARRAEIERELPRGRIAEPEEIAGPIAFLLSEDAVHLSGSVLSVNGGGVLASH